MKNLLFILTIFVVFAGCASLKKQHPLEKNFVDASAQKWYAGISGADGADRGVTFRMKFYRLQYPLNADTLWMNNVALLPEITALGDTTYITSFYFSAGGKDKTLINDTVFTGVLNVYIDNKKHRLGPKPFKVLPVISLM